MRHALLNTLRYTGFALLLLCAVAGCRADANGDSASGSDVPIWDEVANVQPTDLARLRWITGDWRGSGGGYDAFYERYVLDGDSVLRQYSFADSTLTRVTDSSVVRVHGDSLLSESGEVRYFATRLTDSAVSFAPQANALNRFTWRRTSDTSWVAILIPVDTTRQRVEYRLVRINR